jgi:hypothetical protein
MLVGLPTAQAAEVSGTLNSILCGLSNYFCHGTRPETLMLACEGTVTDVSDDKSKSKPSAMGIIVNFKAQTVRGSEGFDTFLVPLTFESDETIIFYEKTDLPNGHTVERRGKISRVTGVLSAENKSWDTKPPNRTQYWYEYFLKCRPAQRMF